AAATTFKFVLLSSSTYLVPFFIAGGVIIVIVKASADAGQGLLAEVVKVIFMNPSILSAEPGVYVAFNMVFDGEKVPFPEVLQTIPPALLNFPFKMTFALFAQTT
ncbi:MAG TPA: hypothetical protein VFK47_01765, partial [Ktedonobacteraceae bacterium]|nr:hypothetical protein [Ktedonobacteraceae bacterium]